MLSPAVKNMGSPRRVFSHSLSMNWLHEKGSGPYTDFDGVIDLLNVVVIRELFGL